MIDFYRLPDIWTVCKYRFPLTRLDKDQRILTIESEKRLDHSVLCAATQRDVNNPGLRSIERQVLDVIKMLVPVVNRRNINGAYLSVPRRSCATGGGADEATCAAAFRPSSSILKQFFCPLMMMSSDIKI